MNTKKHFDKFYENIQLTPAQREDAIIKHTGVCKKLHDYFYPDREYNGDTKLLIGSYGKDTHIRPARDIDVIFMLPQEKFGQYVDNQSNGQSQLLQDIKKILEEKYPDTPIKAFGKVVVLEFADTQHSVDLLPVWENEDGTFTIPNSEGGGSWETWDPRSEIQKIKDSDSKTGKTKSLIRMIKKWTENCSVKIKSVEIENKILDFFQSVGPSKNEYASLVKDFLGFFVQTVLDEETKSHLTTAFDRAAKACEFEAENNTEKAVEEWKKVFGDDFPKLDIEEKEISVVSNSIIRLGDYSHKQELKDVNIFDPKNYPYKAKIIAGLYWGKDDTRVINRRFKTNFESGYQLPPYHWLKYQAITNAPGFDEVWWQVVNTGKHAQSLGPEALRGQIFKGIIEKDGSLIRWERSLYTGMHWIECFIVKDGTCIAKSGRFYVAFLNSEFPYWE